MKNKNLLWLFIIVLLVPTVALIDTGAAFSTTKIYVDPPISAKEVYQVGQNFTVEIKVADVMYLYAWQFFLNWTPSLLEATAFTEGPFLKTVGKTRPVSEIYNDQGRIQAMNTLLGVKEFDAPSGDGTLAYVTFRVKAEGECPIHLYNTRLCRQDQYGNPILIVHTVEDGYFKFPLPIMYVEPSSILESTLGPGSNFTINISVTRVTDLYSWQFFLDWEPDILNVTKISEGPFLSQNDTYETDFLDEINQTGGYVHANCTLVGAVPTANGNGTIATITFLVEATGDTYLRLPLDKTRLFDSGNATIRHATEYGYFNNALRDIAVTKVEASPTTVKAGGSVTIEVTVKNEGIMAETSIDISVTTPSPPSPKYILIGTQNISSLDIEQETTLTFSWNTKGVAKGEYTIRANASYVSGEIDKEDNYMDCTVKVTSPGQITTLLIIGAIIAVAVVGIAIYLYTRRKSRRA